LGQGKLGMFRVALTDFDRTLTRLFDGTALRTAYLDLVVFYERQGVPVDSLSNETDPYAVWHGAYDWMQRNFLPDRTEEVNRRAAYRLAQHELRAAGSAKLFEGVDHTLRWLRRSGLPVLVVSNNSTSALRHALHITRVTRLVRRVFGRGHRFGMDEMKPRPALIHAALLHVQVVAKHAFFVGDSPTDMLAGRLAGVFTIGVCTGKASKQELLEAGADDCITSFAELQSIRFG
jgi:phosphoglycolate phosphatase-like HAD superfamily hydrolase